jgi:hypothetical protein
LGGSRDGDRGQLSGPVQAGQAAGVAPVGLDPIPRALGNKGGCDDIAAHPKGAQQAMQVIASRPGLVAGPQRAGATEALDQAPDRSFVVEDLVDLGDVAVRREHRHRDRVLRDVHADVGVAAMRKTGHGRFLLPYVGSIRRSTRMIHEDAAAGEPAVPC